jgi:adenylate kinase family enzyme
VQGSDGALVHEFCHSFCNPIADKWFIENQQFRELCEKTMSDKNLNSSYNNPQVAGYEYVTRAFNTIYEKEHFNGNNDEWNSLMQRMLDYHKRMGFPYIEEVLELAKKHNKEVNLQLQKPESSGGKDGAEQNQKKEMPRGIKFVGPSGSGKTFFADELVKRINAHHVATGKYRLQAVDELGIEHERFIGNTKEDIEGSSREQRNALWETIEPRMIELTEQAIVEDGRFFIMASGLSTCEPMKRLEELYDAVVFVETPLEERKRRVAKREKGRDALIERLVANTAEYDDESIPNPRNSRVLDKKWAETLSCQKITVDGSKTPDEMIEEFMQKLPQLREMAVQTQKQRTSGGKDGTE